jgi:hypothetical protein
MGLQSRFRLRRRIRRLSLSKRRTRKSYYFVAIDDRHFRAPMLWGLNGGADNRSEVRRLDEDGDLVFSIYGRTYSVTGGVSMP